MKQWMCDGGWEWWAGGRCIRECDIISLVFRARLAEWDRKLIPDMRWCIAKWAICESLRRRCRWSRKGDNRLTLVWIIHYPLRVWFGHLAHFLIFGTILYLCCILGCATFYFLLIKNSTHYWKSYQFTSLCKVDLSNTANIKSWYCLVPHSLTARCCQGISAFLLN